MADPDDEESQFSIWTIVLIVLCALAVLIGGFILYHRYNRIHYWATRYVSNDEKNPDELIEQFFKVAVFTESSEYIAGELRKILSGLHELDQHQIKPFLTKIVEIFDVLSTRQDIETALKQKIQITIGGFGNVDSVQTTEMLANKDIEILAAHAVICGDKNKSDNRITNDYNLVDVIKKQLNKKISNDKVYECLLTLFNQSTIAPEIIKEKLQPCLPEKNLNEIVKYFLEANYGSYITLNLETLLD